jgi:hypothetical protein
MKRKFMWNHFAAVTALAATALTSTSYGVRADNIRDLSGVDAVAKAQIFVGLHHYVNYCAPLSESASDILGQLKFMTDEMDKSTLDKMTGVSTIVHEDGNAADNALFCKNLKPAVDSVDTLAQKLPVLRVTEMSVDHSAKVAEVADEQDENGIRVRLGKLAKVYGNFNQNIAVTNNGSGKYKFVTLECGFYYKGEQVGTGMGSVANMFPGNTKHVSVYGLQLDKVDNAMCSVGNAF